MIGKRISPYVLDLRGVGACEHCIVGHIHKGLNEGLVSCQVIEAVLLTEEQIEALVDHTDFNSTPQTVFGVSIWRPA